METKLLLLLALLAATGAWRVLAFDANEDGMSDVYASHYGLSQDSAGILSGTGLSRIDAPTLLVEGTGTHPVIPASFASTH